MIDWRYTEAIATLPMVPLWHTHLLPDRSGLYIAVISHAYIGYVGIATHSLRRRWYSHRNDKGPAIEALAQATDLGDSIHQYALIHYAVDVGDADALRDAERRIMEIWNPPLNAPRWGKGGSPMLTREHPRFRTGNRDRMPIYVDPDHEPTELAHAHGFEKHLRLARETR
jgi:hypothetical protein